MKFNMAGSDYLWIGALKKRDGREKTEFSTVICISIFYSQRSRLPLRAERIIRSFAKAGLRRWTIRKYENLPQNTVIRMIFLERTGFRRFRV